MKNLTKCFKNLAGILILCCYGLSANSQTTDLKDYVITGYYAKSASATFKTPFLINFGENNTFQKLDVEGKLHEGKYSVANGKVKCEYVGGFENYTIEGETVSFPDSRTFALFKKKIFGNQLKGNQYTGILYKQNSNVAVRASYQFIGNKFSITDENGTVSSYKDYTLVGNMAGYNWNGPSQLKTKMIRNVFVQYGSQLVVINIYRNEGATYGILDLVSK
jgi:hypothetical protein